MLQPQRLAPPPALTPFATAPLPPVAGGVMQLAAPASAARRLQYVMHRNTLTQGSCQLLTAGVPDVAAAASSATCTNTSRNGTITASGTCSQGL